MNENKPKPSWIDKANLASNVLQNIQLEEVHSSLRTLSKLEAERAQLELNEQQAKEREDDLREVLWKMESLFNRFINSSAYSTCAIYVGSRKVRETASGRGLTSAAFRQLEDKDRCGDFLNQIEQALHDSHGKLSDQQKADVTTYLRYESEAEELDGLIERLQAENAEKSRQLEEAAQRRAAALQSLNYWRQMSGDPEKQKEFSQRKRKRGLAKTSIGIVAVPVVLSWMVVVVMVVLALYILATDGSDGLNWRDVEFGVILFSVTSIITGLWVKLDKLAKPEKSFQEEISGLEQEVTSIENHISSLERGEGKLTRSIHGFFNAPGMLRENGIFQADDDGYIFSEFIKKLAYENDGQPSPEMLENPDRTVNEWMQKNGLVMVLEIEGKYVCYSAKYKSALPAAFIDQVKKYFKLAPTDTVLWANDIFNELQEVPALGPVFGREMEEPKRPSPRATCALANPEEFTCKAFVKFQAKNLDELAQRKREREAFIEQFRLANHIPFE